MPPAAPVRCPALLSSRESSPDVLGIGPVLACPSPNWRLRAQFAIGRTPVGRLLAGFAQDRLIGPIPALRGLLHSRAAFGIGLPVAGERSPPISRMRV